MKQADEQTDGHGVHVNALIYGLSKKTDNISRLLARFQTEHFSF
jgi:hypothetical protein